MLDGLQNIIWICWQFLKVIGKSFGSELDNLSKNIKDMVRNSYKGMQDILYAFFDYGLGRVYCRRLVARRKIPMTIEDWKTIWIP
jgi:hypothetical protein